MYPPALLSAAIFGNVSSIMLRMYQGSDELHEKLQSVKDFVTFHHIPKTLASRLQESFQHNWAYTNGIDMNNVLKGFPECLQADICLHLNRNLLNTCPAFKGASPGCLRVLSLKFRSTHAPPGDTLLHPGDILTSIYFIARGSVEISKDDTVMAILGKNDIFGEDFTDGERWQQETASKSMYFVRALSYCDFNKIELSDLREILQLYPEFAEQFLKRFQVTFNLKKGTLLHRRIKQKLDDETLRFIRQRRPRLQCKRRGTDDTGLRHRRVNGSEGGRGNGEGREESEEECGGGILEFSPQAATHQVTENDFHADPLLTKSKTRIQREKSTKEGRNSSTKTRTLPVKKDNTSESLTAHQPLSPMASSGTTYTPKSSSSTGHLWKFPPLDYEIRQHPEKGSIQSLSDVEHRLESLHERMHKFESDLFTTVDSILKLLGQKPKVTRDLEEICTSPGNRGDKAARPKGVKLRTSPNDNEKWLKT
ncbi:hypothetical protein ACOMHN_043338 [Nucella lapillus]